MMVVMLQKVERLEVELVGDIGRLAPRSRIKEISRGGLCEVGSFQHTSF
jgi:hypothetical protein